MDGLFTQKGHLDMNVRSRTDFQLPRINTVSFGENSLRYLGPKIWEIVPTHIKDLECLKDFTIAIKRWIPYKCPCRLCKEYIQGVGFVVGVN